MEKQIETDHIFSYQNYLVGGIKGSRKSVNPLNLIKVSLLLKLMSMQTQQTYPNNVLLNMIMWSTQIIDLEEKCFNFRKMYSLCSSLPVSTRISFLLFLPMTYYCWLLILEKTPILLRLAQSSRNRASFGHKMYRKITDDEWKCL